MHGFVLMEVFGQLRPITAQAEPFFEEFLDQQLRVLTLRRADPPT